MSLSFIIEQLAYSGFFYQIVALQVSGGFPPFYRRLIIFKNAEDVFEEVPPFIIGQMVAMALAAITGMAIFFAAFGLIAVWCGLRVRENLRAAVGGPLP